MALITVISNSNLTGKLYRLNFLSLLLKANHSKSAERVVLNIYPSQPSRWLGTNAESTHPEFSDLSNAYDVLGVSETCSSEEIKASFRKLAKETHPDLVSSPDGDSSKRFVEILAAYEILSDPTKRSIYDQYLLAMRHILQKQERQGSNYQMYATNMTAKQMEVVEWLRWYRYALKEILSERTLPSGTGYFDVLQRNFYSAVHSAYFGPEIQSLDLLPDRFEAEVRSVFETPEVLHLVSGRDLFGIVRIADEVPGISDVSYEKLTSNSSNSDLSSPLVNAKSQTNFSNCGSSPFSENNAGHANHCALDAYKDLELHVCGRLIAKATRVPPEGTSDERNNECSQDHIQVFYEEPLHYNTHFSKKSCFQDSVSKILLAKITGLGTNPDESSCEVYDNNGTKTHVILKHRTPLVKHMNWFQMGDDVSICECRCTRARLPPSKFWLFEPRCSMHDIGGWYIETFGRDKKNQTTLSQRDWDSCSAHPLFEKRLHPAVYLLALAYRTLDMESSRKVKRTIKDVASQNMLKIFSWCKKLV